MSDGGEKSVGTKIVRNVIFFRTEDDARADERDARRVFEVADAFVLDAVFIPLSVADLRESTPRALRNAGRFLRPAVARCLFRGIRLRRLQNARE